MKIDGGGAGRRDAGGCGDVNEELFDEDGVESLLCDSFMVVDVVVADC